jgi:hypothetical protein
MPYIRLELVIPPQHQFQVVKYRLIQVNYFTALLTDQMVVVPFVRRMIPDPSPTEVSLGYQTKPMEQLQCPVYGGYIKVGIFGHYLREYLLGADVMVAVFNGRQDHQTLRCQTVALLTQPVYDIARLSHIRQNTDYRTE